ncbi:hypothetical protein J7400_18980 [Shimia sp. R9_2]|uniref:hypothetical protein n=1 Tax=Shimia sp. R9_2 TaxID=2821112 RepID=UPI001ADA3EEC|nr:hypothetical protein [Shimia sp. R9_2]MBO9398762.1 hypothetical protein [Shimia sp. R9_2]
MPKLSIIELPIHTYVPTEQGRKCIAHIGDLPMRFKGDTVEQAKANADAWRHGEYAKEKKANADKAARAAAMKAGRQNKEQAHA